MASTAPDSWAACTRRWRRQIESGRAKSITDLAEQEGVTDAYVCRLLPLTCLAPEIVEAILDGRQPKGAKACGGAGEWAGCMGRAERRLGSLSLNESPGALPRLMRARSYAGSALLIGHIDGADRASRAGAYICGLPALTCLAADIVEAILEGRQPTGLRLAEMLGNKPLAWEEQRLCRRVSSSTVAESPTCADHRSRSSRRSSRER